MGLKIVPGFTASSFFPLFRFGIIHDRIIIPKQKERCQTFMPESVLFLQDFFHSPFHFITNSFRRTYFKSRAEGSAKAKTMIKNKRLFFI